MTDAFQNSLALRWDPGLSKFEIRELSKISWPVTNLGCMHGAFLVERARTFGRKFVNLDPHLNRLSLGCDLLGIPFGPFRRQFQSGVESLLSESRTLLESQDDASLCIVVSPGDYYTGQAFQAVVHWLPIPWRTLADWYRHGSTLIRVQYASGAGECWPSDIKSRSRLNYYLADREAKRRSEHSLGLLCSSRGMVADCSAANLLIVDKAGAIFSPRREDIVQGTSLAYVEQLLAGIGMNIEYRDVHFEELYDASEVLLVGNTGCLWPAISLGKRPIGTTTNGPICATLQERWEKSISFNWRSQALRIADTLASDAQ